VQGGKVAMEQELRHQAKQRKQTSCTNHCVCLRLHFK
jgi:hypothetical protein